MGAKEAKPDPPATTEAKANADLALDGLISAAEAFLLNCRVGQITGDTLGYKLAGDKLINFEKRLIAQTTANATKDEISKAIDAIFSQDWAELTKLCMDTLAHFLSGDVAKPTDKAMNEVFAKGYLKYEYYNLVQYSVYIKRTNSSSIGTTMGNTMAALQTVVCAGLVDYAKVDPQTVLYYIRKSQPDLTPEQLEELLSTIERAIGIAARVIQAKQQFEKETPDPHKPLQQALQARLDEKEAEHHEPSLETLQARLLYVKKARQELKTNKAEEGKPVQKKKKKKAKKQAKARQELEANKAEEGKPVQKKKEKEAKKA